MIRRAVRRRGELEHLELLHADNPHAIQVVHQLEVRAAAGERLAVAVVRDVDVVEHAVPGFGARRGVGVRVGVGVVVRVGTKVVDETLVRTQRAARCARGSVRAEVAEDVGFPFSGVGKGGVAVEDVEDADVPVG